MIYPSTRASLDSAQLTLPDHSLLVGFLAHFSETEQQAFVDIAATDPYFWTKLLVRMAMVKQELAQGASDVIAKQMEEAIKTLQNV